MSKGYKIDWELYFKRLIVLGKMGIYITTADGHYWIENGEEPEFGNAGEILKKSGIVVNNKIYGGFIEAIETIRHALFMADVDIDDWEFCDEWDFPPEGVDDSRITLVEKGKGGIF